MSTITNSEHFPLQGATQGDIEYIDADVPVSAADLILLRSAEQWFDEDDLTYYLLRAAVRVGIPTVLSDPTICVPLLVGAADRLTVYVHPGNMELMAGVARTLSPPVTVKDVVRAALLVGLRAFAVHPLLFVEAFEEALFGWEPRWGCQDNRTIGHPDR